MAPQDICQVQYIDKNKVATARSRLLADDDVIKLSEIFKVLGDPTRVRIIQALSVEELCVCDIASLLGTTKSAVSHQLRLLRSIGAVKFWKSGKIVNYSLRDSHISNLFSEGLRHLVASGGKE